MRDNALSRQDYDKAIEAWRGFSAHYERHGLMDNAFHARVMAAGVALDHLKSAEKYRTSAFEDLAAQKHLFYRERDVYDEKSLADAKANAEAGKSVPGAAGFRRPWDILKWVRRQSLQLKYLNLESGLRISRSIEVQARWIMEMDMVWAFGRYPLFGWPYGHIIEIIRHYRDFILSPNFRRYFLERGYVAPEGMRKLALHIMRDEDPNWR